MYLPYPSNMGKMGYKVNFLVGLTWLIQSFLSYKLIELKNPVNPTFYP